MNGKQLYNTNYKLYQVRQNVFRNVISLYGFFPDSMIKILSKVVKTFKIVKLYYQY